MADAYLLQFSGGRVDLLVAINISSSDDFIIDMDFKSDANVNFLRAFGGFGPESNLNSRTLIFGGGRVRLTDASGNDREWFTGLDISTIDNYTFTRTNGVLDLIIDGVTQSGGFTGDTATFEIGMIGGTNINFPTSNAKLYKFAVTKNGTLINNYDPTLSNGTGAVLTDSVGNNNGTLINFPPDNSQWVLYDDGTGGGEVTSDATISFAPFEFAGDASATLPQPESTVAFDLPEFTIAGNQSASLPQPTSSAAISFNALDFSGSQTATLPQPISTASFELPSFTVSGDISASVPANVVESSASFSLAPFEFSASQSASLPQPAISGAFTLPAFDITGSLSPGIPQPIISGGFDLPSFTFSGSGSVTLPQPISSGGFELPGITVLGAVSISGVVINVQNNGIIFLSAGNNSIQLSAGESLIYLH